MKMPEVRAIAKRMGIDASVKRNKQDLIREIQSAEGNYPCYKTSTDCSETDCLWRDDCLPKK